MRLDKYLKVSRLIKRRTVANEACDGGRVSANGKVVKASYDVKVGDVIEIRFGSKLLKIKVTDVREQVGKSDAATLYEVMAQRTTGFGTAILSVQNRTAFDKKVVNGIKIKKMLDICFGVWYSSQQEKNVRHRQDLNHKITER